MISDLQNLGEWLNEKDLVDFGKNVNADDYICTVSYQNGNFSLNSIKMTKDCNLNFYAKSCFKDNLYHSSDQNVIIPSLSNLFGFTPFFVKLDNKFKKRNGKFNSKKVDTFKSKIKRSLDANKNNKDFVSIVNLIFPDMENTFISKCELNAQQISNLRLLHKKMSFQEVSNLIINYYQFLFDNTEDIINLVSNFENSDEFSNKKGKFFIACVFEDYKDLINDFFYLYSNFLQSRSKKYIDFEEGVCSICGNKNITYPPLTYFNISSSFNYSPKLENSKLKLCKNCSSFVKYAEDKLLKIIKNPNILIIPKIKYGTYDNFLKISNTETSSFEKINRFLRDCDNFNFDLLIINIDKSKNSLITIKRYVENYRAFLVNFEDLFLYDNNKMKYLFNEVLTKNELTNVYIRNTFDFENIFKEFFYELNSDNRFIFPNFYHFYEIYTKDLTGSQGIFNNFSSNTISLFSKYSEHIFSFIYELNLDSLNSNIINDIVLHSILIFQKKSFGEKNFRFDILKRLNYYFMFKKEFLEDNMLSNEDVINIKKCFGQYDGEKVHFEKEDKNVIKKLIEKDVSLKYYLLGQFISYIDILKGANNKNNDVFLNFINNINRNNIKKLFVTEILQKNTYYINRMGKKAKFIFELFESNLNNLFNDEEITYEDYLLIIFTGYYTENILKKDYKFEEE